MAIDYTATYFALYSPPPTFYPSGTAPHGPLMPPSASQAIGMYINKLRDIVQARVLGQPDPRPDDGPPVPTAVAELDFFQTVVVPHYLAQLDAIRAQL
jgi:hypothetical protein